MGYADKDHAEKNFQEQFVQELKYFKWQSPDKLDGTKHRVDVGDLINNWRGHLSRMNQDKLEGIPLTDNEFNQVMQKVRQISNSYEAAKILSIESSVGKIDGILRDDHPNIVNKQLTLTIFKKPSVSGGDSSYEIAREVWTQNNDDKANNYRFDLILLINGLPLINIELKRTDKNLDDAFYQFKRYYQMGEYSNNFMAFSQMMVMSSEIDTRYFATPKSVNAFNPSFVFRWANRDNKPVTYWKDVIKHFLMIPMAHQMVGDYVIIDEARNEEDRKHMVMRPYQVHALQAIEGAAAGWGNKEPHGGFVWHTTGSGKTITSFKTALFLSTRMNFDKVIFLVDRRELDSKTSENFKAYAVYESVDVDDTSHTYQLKKHLLSHKGGIIVTTTFKLNNLVKDLLDNDDDTLSRKKFIFIIDEAHRTTMGQMMGTIKDYFRRNSLFYGFTGTPLFEENEVKGKINSKSEVINTTEKLFGQMLHQYTIDEAIADGNVLGFHVDYINTGEFESYEQLRDDLAERLKLENPDQKPQKVEHYVAQLSNAEIEALAAEKNILLYYDETHIPRVVSKILDNWDYQSQNRVFNAILTVAYKNRVTAYYDEFQKQLAERQMQLNVAMTFSFGTENDPSGYTPPEIIEKMFKDYAKFTGIEFIVGDKRHGEDAYFEDLVDRSTRGGSGRNPKFIDLVIVADQLLTGYDSKRLNTLYVDRKLALQGLVQAYSRTNRVFGSEKEFGTIINFRFPALTEEAVRKALKLYGSGGTSSPAIVDEYRVAVKKFFQEVAGMRAALEDPTKWADLRYDKERKQQFIATFKSASEQLNTVQQYYEFSWESLSSIIDEHTWMRYVGAYKNLTRSDETDDPLVSPPLLGKTRLVSTQIIDAAYIIMLIGEKIQDVNGTQTVDAETLRLIYEEIQELSNMGDDVQAGLLKEFVDTELLPGHLPADVKFGEAYAAWRKQIKENKINEFAEKWGLDPKVLTLSLGRYDLNQPNKPIPYYNELMETRSEEYFRKLTPQQKVSYIKDLMVVLRDWLAETKSRYGYDDLQD